MTTSATLEIKVAAERTFAVVACRAGIVSRRKVFLRPRGRNLSPLGQPGDVIVTVGTAKPLTPAVIGVTESEAKSGAVGRSSRVRFLIVTHVASCDVTPVRLRVGGVTRVTLIVRNHSGRDRQCHPASQLRAVAGGATIFWPRGAVHVLRMIELEIKAFFESIGKGFQWRIISIDVCVADRAHRHVGRGEL